MSFVSTLASLTSNTPLSRLVPDNNDLATHFSNYRSAVSDGSFQRDINRRFPKESVETLKDDQSKRISGAINKKNDAQMEREIRRADMLGTEAQRMHELKQNSKYVDSSGNLNGDGLHEARVGQQKQLAALSKQRQEASRGLRSATKDYFMDGDLGTKAMRWGAAAGAYGGVAVGTRALTGGSATTNNQGQRDIAGIPFI